MKYWVFDKDKVRGPYDKEQLSSLSWFDHGTLVCRADKQLPTKNDWYEAKTFSELAPLFIAANQMVQPPPPPDVPSNESKDITIKQQDKSATLNTLPNRELKTSQGKIIRKPFKIMLGFILGTGLFAFFILPFTSQGKKSIKKAEREQKEEKPNSGSESTGSILPHDDLSLFLSKYDKPDVDDSTAYDDPRPPIVTRILTYKKENVYAAYVADVPAGASPPYDKWKLISFYDLKTKKVIYADEAVRRLKARLKKS